MTNLRFGKSDWTFADAATLTAVLLDRLLHNADQRNQTGMQEIGRHLVDQTRTALCKRLDRARDSTSCVPGALIQSQSFGVPNTRMR
ncbi:hypothetical protein SAMN05445850_3537 [Paraburkholderia tuberum]|uniref:IstB-like ATP binding protein n=1 Tax=Paraburkholderia tuberum TaxID=157910 RepID=A0A1H1HFX9_9BURK|nr:hypothetical protein SAMN05445850_3537 [Paraburkholderia tuberum]